MKETEENTNQWKDFCVLGTEKLILFECPCYLEPSIDSMQSLLSSSDIFHRNRKNNAKMCMELQDC